MPGDIGFTREDPLHGAVRMRKDVVGPLSVDVRFDTISQFDCEMALLEQQRLLQENVTELSKLRSFDNLEPTLDSHAVLEIARLATERLRSFNRYLGWFDPATCRSRDVVRVMPSIGRKGVASWSVVQSIFKLSVRVRSESESLRIWSQSSMLQFAVAKISIVS